MSCDDLNSLLGPFLDGELSTRDEAAVRAHVASCDRCAGRLEALRALQGAVRSTRPAPSDDGLESLRRRIVAEGPREPRPIPGQLALWAGLAAAIVLVVALSIWLSGGWHHSDPRPPATVSAPSHFPGESMSEADLDDPDSPCERAEECGRGAREIWPALSI